MPNTTQYKLQTYYTVCWTLHTTSWAQLTQFTQHCTLHTEPKLCSVPNTTLKAMYTMYQTLYTTHKTQLTLCNNTAHYKWKITDTVYQTLHTIQNKTQNTRWTKSFILNIFMIKGLSFKGMVHLKNNLYFKCAKYIYKF